MTALSAQGYVTNNGDIFEPAYLMAAVGAAGGRFGQIERCCGKFFGMLIEWGGYVSPGFTTEVAGGFHPFQVHHQWQTVDDDVEEAAKEEAQGEDKPCEEGGVG